MEQSKKTLVVRKYHTTYKLLFTRQALAICHFGLAVYRLNNHATNRAYFNAIRRIVIMFAANAGIGINLVMFAFHRNRITRALRHTHIAVNAAGINNQRKRIVIIRHVIFAITHKGGS